MYKNVKFLMGSENYNIRTHLIYNGEEIHNKQEQADVFATIWEKIMNPNTLWDTDELQ